LSALIFQESRFETNAKSPQGACGLTQVVTKYVPETCNQLRENPALAIQVGATLLKAWLTRNKHSYTKSLQCYATGYKCNYPIYAKKIIKRSKKLKKIYLLTKRKMNDALDQGNFNRSE
jgi:soluble lytic murein transglycosylase-like protein